METALKIISENQAELDASGWEPPASRPSAIREMERRIERDMASINAALQIVGKRMNRRGAISDYERFAYNPGRWERPMMGGRV